MSAVPAPAMSMPTPWRQALPGLVILIIAIIALFRDTAVGMVAIWERSDTFAHAFLVPPISLWLIWRCRHELARLLPAPQPLVLIAMLACAVLWLLGDLVAVNALTQFALVSMLVLAVPLMLGLQVTRTILFPLGFLFFCVPVGEFLLPTLMEATADFTIAALQMSGIPVYREGLRFVIPSGAWSVVEACSGVRYLIASLMVGTLFAYLNYRSMKRRWIFAGISILVPVVANWLRAYMIVMIGHLSDNKLATGVDHIVYGWVFFGIVIMLMFIVGARWAEPDVPLPDVPVLRADPQAMHQARLALPVGVVAAALAVLLLPAGVLKVMDHGLTTAAPALVLPEKLEGGWAAASEINTAWQPVFEGPTQVATRRYLRDGRQVWVYVAYYRGQTYDRKLVNSQNILIGSNDLFWNNVRSSSRSVDIAGAGAVKLGTAELLATANVRPGQPARLTIWQTYWVHDTFTASDSWAKVEAALERLQGRGDDGASLLIHTEGGREEGADALLESFTKINLQPLAVALRSARARR